MADTVGSDLVSLLQAHVNQVKTVLESRSNLAKTLKEKDKIIRSHNIENRIKRISSGFHLRANTMQPDRS